MKDLLCDEFQQAVDDCLLRHRSILDVISKLQESAARINRAVAKAVTGCGCLTINAEKQKVPSDITLDQLKDYMATHLAGRLCEQCKDTIEAEMGSALFYLAALCNLLDLNLYDVLIRERKKIGTLGPFNFS